MSMWTTTTTPSTGKAMFPIRFQYTAKTGTWYGWHDCVECGKGIVEMMSKTQATCIESRAWYWFLFWQEAGSEHSNRIRYYASLWGECFIFVSGNTQGEKRLGFGRDLRCALAVTKFVALW